MSSWDQSLVRVLTFWLLVSVQQRVLYLIMIYRESIVIALIWGCPFANEVRSIMLDLPKFSSKLLTLHLPQCSWWIQNLTYISTMLMSWWTVGISYYTGLCESQLYWVIFEPLVKVAAVLQTTFAFHNSWMQTPLSFQENIFKDEVCTTFAFIIALCLDVDDSISCKKEFLNYRYFVMGIHQSLVDSHHKGPVTWSFALFLDASLNKLQCCWELFSTMRPFNVFMKFQWVPAVYSF